MAVFQHLQQVSSVLCAQLHEPPVIQDQHIHFGEVGQELGVLAISLGNGQLPQQSGQADVLAV